MTTVLRNSMIVQEYLEQIWDAFKDGICITDADGIVLHVNSRHEELTGIPRDHMLGQSVREFVQHGVMDVVLNPEVFKTGETVTRVQRVATGRKLIIQGIPVFDAQGRPVLCITFLRDVTVLSDMRHQIALQNELLDAFQQLSTQEGHDLKKTPKVAFSPVMQRLYAEMSTIAETDASVLLLGETGVGKDVLARRIHRLSPRAGRPFIKVDCGSIPENLIETELFGYAAGTFSGANKNGKIGLIEAAAGGTLFLDEIGELPMQMQTRLLRFLQDWEIVRVGSTSPKQVDVRILAATNKNLEKSIAHGEFRSDLYYRLKVAVINIPPLRDRESDIVPLAKTFLEVYGGRYHRTLELSPEAEAQLQEYKWPGNVRELENMMQGLVVTCKHPVIRPTDLPFPASAVKSTAPAAAAAAGMELRLDGRSYKEIMKELENNVLCAAMQQYGNITEVARHFQVDRSTIFRKVKELEKRGLLRSK